LRSSSGKKSPSSTLSQQKGRTLKPELKARQENQISRRKVELRAKTSQASRQKQVKLRAKNKSSFAPKKGLNCARPFFSMAFKQNGNGSGGVVPDPFPAIVELNVGGVFYSTSLATLTSEPESRSVSTIEI
jgi:hypothetical protein